MTNACVTKWRVIQLPCLDGPASKRFGLRFGALVMHPNLVAVGDAPEVINIVKEPIDAGIIGAEWHTDTTCFEASPMRIILHALEVPSMGCDTLFANQHMAYEAPGRTRAASSAVPFIQLEI